MASGLSGIVTTVLRCSCTSTSDMMPHPPIRRSTRGSLSAARRRRSFSPDLWAGMNISRQRILLHPRRRRQRRAAASGLSPYSPHQSDAVTSPLSMVKSFPENNRISIKPLGLYEFASTALAKHQVDCHMDVMKGRIPFLKPIDAFVDVGDEVTILVKMNIAGKVTATSSSSFPLPDPDFADDSLTLSNQTSKSITAGDPCHLTTLSPLTPVSPVPYEYDMRASGLTNVPLLCLFPFSHLNIIFRLSSDSLCMHILSLFSSAP